MKELWIEIDETLPDNVKKKLSQAASAICDAILVKAKDVKTLQDTKGRIASNSDPCDIIVLETYDEDHLRKLKAADRTTAMRVTIHGQKDEEIAIKAAELSTDYLIVNCPDWKIIPLENLIARTRGKSSLLAEVSNTEEAKLALETLELGADGVILKTANLQELKKTATLTKEGATKVDLVSAEVINLKEIGTGARVCIDTCDLMKPGEGILVGCQSSGLFLIQAEVHESPYVQTRPFRVNAGPISLYTLSSSTRTRYLSEFKAGDDILVVDRTGNTRVTNVARAKIEWRPMILVEAEHNGKLIKTIVQNAETIRLVTKDGSKSITELAPTDHVMVLIEEGGRHFGTLVKEETVIEQ
jgi:3-dehydroquinate synthase II